MSDATEICDDSPPPAMGAQEAADSVLGPSLNTLSVSSSSLLASGFSLDQSSPALVDSEEGQTEVDPPAQFRVQPAPSSGAVKRQVEFMTMPWFSGVQHGVAWSKASPNTGPLLKNAGLVAQSLREPGAIAYIDPAVTPTNEEQWRALFETSFNDLANDPKPSDRTWEEHFKRRTALEKRYYSNEDAMCFIRTAPGFIENTLFQARLVTPDYALATVVTCTDESDRVEEAAADDRRETASYLLLNELSLRIGEATTEAGCQEIADALTSLKKRQEERSRTDKDELTKIVKLVDECKARLDYIKAQLAALEAHKNAETGKDTVVDDLFFIDPETMRTGAVQPVVRPDGEQSQAAHTAQLATLPRPSHVISAVSVNLTEGSLLVPLSCLSADSVPPATQPLFAHRLDYKGRGPFEQIPQGTMKGTLWTLNMEPSRHGKTEWHALKTGVQIPCTFAAHKKEVLIADHAQAYIVKMPSGKRTAECYSLQDLGTPALPQFKTVACSLSPTHVCLVGYRRSAISTSPLIVVIHRQTRLCTFLQSDVPCVSAILSLTVADTLLMGMKDGTLLRYQLPSAPSRKGRPSFKLFPPLVDALESYGGALTALRKSRGATYHIEVFAGSQDWVQHVGRPVPITRIVERGQRIVLSTSAGLHLLRMFHPEDSEGRRVLMSLHGNASYDWRGNLLVILKETNALQILQIHDCKMEAKLDPPVMTGGDHPPESASEWSAIALHDQSIAVIHPDGSRRVIELRDPAHFVEPDEKAPDLRSEEDKARTFLPEAKPQEKVKKVSKKKGGGAKKKK
jgi:hypothetical protein